MAPALMLDQTDVMVTPLAAEAPQMQKQKPSIPSTMRAAALDRFGGPEVLTIHELPVPAFEALNEAIQQGNVVVPIKAEFPLDQAASAHERLAAGHVLGKVVLRVQPD